MVTKSDLKRIKKIGFVPRGAKEVDGAIFLHNRCQSQSPSSDVFQRYFEESKPQGAFIPPGFSPGNR